MFNYILTHTSLQQKHAVIPLLFLLQILASMAMDIHLPVAPRIVSDLGTTEFMVQLLVIMSVVLTTMTPLFWGYLSDCYGRRQVFFPACLFLVTGQFLCAVAPTIEFLLMSRFIQYLGAGAMFSVNMAIICDQYAGRERAQMLALLEMTIPIALIIAPIFGSFFASAVHWRFSFLFLAVCQLFTLLSLVKRLPETLVEKKQFHFKQIYTVSFRLLQNRKFTHYAVFLAFVNAPYMIFITHSSFFYINHFRYSASSYAFIHSMLVFIYLLGIVIYRKLMTNQTLTGALNQNMWGLVLFFMLNAAITLGILPFNVGWVTVSMAISCLVSGPIIASCNSLAISEHNDYLGTCSALVELFVGAVAGVSMFLSSCFVQTYGNKSVYGFMSLTALISVLLWIRTPSDFRKIEGSQNR